MYICDQCIPPSNYQMKNKINIYILHVFLYFPFWKCIASMMFLACCWRLRRRRCHLISSMLSKCFLFFIKVIHFTDKSLKKWNSEFFFNNTTMEEAPLEIKNNGRSCCSMKDSETTMEEAFHVNDNFAPKFYCFFFLKQKMYIYMFDYWLYMDPNKYNLILVF